MPTRAQTDVTKGLGYGEAIYDLWEFDLQTYGIVRGNREGTPSWTRSVRIDKDTTNDAGEAVKGKIVPLFNGTLRVVSIEVAVKVKTGCDTRAITDARTDAVYRVTYLDENSKAVASDVEITDSELLKSQGQWAWLSRLGLSERIGQQTGKYGMLRNYLRSLVDQSRKLSPHRTVIREVGLMSYRNQMVFASASGDVISTAGIVPGLRADARSNSKDSKTLGVPGPTAGLTRVQKRDGLLSLNELRDLTPGKPAVALVGLGTLAVSPLASLYDSARGVDIVIGPSLSGKTASAMLVTAPQYANRDPSTAAAPITMLTNPKGVKGGTTPAGVRVKLETLPGHTVLCDDAVKTTWDVSHRSHANDSLIGPTIRMSTPGDAGPAQATVAPAHEGGGVVSADSGYICARLVISMETLPFEGLLSDDSGFNRCVNLFWDSAYRCSVATFDRLNTLEHNTRCHAGYSAIVEWILDHHTEWEGIRSTAGQLLSSIENRRDRNKYAVRLAGLMILDAVWADYSARYSGDANGLGSLAALAIPELILAAKHEAAYGTYSAESRATSSLLDATVETVRLMVGSFKGYFAAPRQQDVEFDVPPDLDGLPEQVELSTLGWQLIPPKDVEENGPQFRTPLHSVRFGSLHKVVTQNKTLPWEHNIRFNSSEWAQFCDVLRVEAGRRKWATGDREAIKSALVAAGIAKSAPSNGRQYTNVDYLALCVNSTDADSNSEIGN